MKKKLFILSVLGILSIIIINVMKKEKYIQYDNGLFDDEYDEECDEYLRETLGDLYV